MTFEAAADLIQSLEARYSDCLASIGDISADTSQQRQFIEMDFNCLHFDKIPYHWGANKKDPTALSVDTVLLDKTKNTLYLVEFKSSWPKDRDSQQLRFKCYESLAKLLKHWTLVLKKDKRDFFELKINYCVITRGKVNQNINHSSFLEALNDTGNFFKLKYLDGAFIDKTRIIVQEDEIFQFLSRVTEAQEMNYHCMDGSVVSYPKVARV